MRTVTIPVAFGTESRVANVACPRGERLRISVAVTSGGAPMDLSSYSVMLGWDTASPSTTLPAPTRVSGDSSGTTSFDIDTSLLTASAYAFDVWLENETTYERTRICDKAFVQLIGAVANMNLSPTIAMTALPVAVSPGSVAISGTAADVDGTLTAASFAVRVNGTLQTPVFTYSAGAWSTSVTLTAGAASIAVTVTDAHGGTATATRTTTAVTTPSLTVSPIATQDEDAIPVTVTMLPAPASPVSVSIRVNGVANSTVTVGTNGTGTGATTAQTAGTYSIVARYAWTQGGVDIDSPAVSAVVQDQLPTVAITSHTGGQHVEVGTLAVYGTVTHASATPAQLVVEFDLDDAFTSATEGVYNSGAGRWEANLTVATEASHTIRMRAHDATSPAEWVVATPIVVSSTPQYVEFTTTAAATFSPELTLVGGSAAVATWTVVETGAQTTGLEPSIALGGQIRTVRLSVDVPGDVRTLNLGFDSTRDAGLQNAGSGYDHPVQPVSGVRYLHNLPNLTHFFGGAGGAAHSLTGALDLTGNPLLRHVECFNARFTSCLLPTIEAGQTPENQRLRLCFELNNLGELDLNPVADVLYDLRAAVQQSGGITFTALTAPLAQCYHFCVRDQTVTGMPAMANLPVVEELWAWNTGLSGALTLVSTVLRSLQVYSNSLTSVSIPTATCLDIQLQDNTLGTVAVDALLNQVEAYGTSNGVLNLENNSGPTAAGELDALALIARGWQAPREPQVGEGVLSDNFNRADGTVGNGWHTPAGFAATGTIASNMLQRTDSAGYQIYCNPAGGGLPADYTVTAVVPDATIRTGYWGIVLRWDGAEGVRLLCSTGDLTDPQSQLWIGNASTFNGGAVTVTPDNAMPASWAVNQSHTIAVTAVGTLIQVRLDGTLVCHATVTTNAAATGTEYGICGEGNNRLWDSIGTSV